MLIKRKFLGFVIMFSMILTPMLAPLPVAAVGTPCKTPMFLTLPAWYRGVYEVPEHSTTGDCETVMDDTSDIWVIVLNIIDILLQLTAYFAVGYIIWGGFKFMKSQGSPDEINSARGTITSGITGLAVAIAAVAIVKTVEGIFF